MDINRYLLLQILWKTLLLSLRLSYLYTYEGCKSGFTKIGLECKVCEKWRKEKGKGVKHQEQQLDREWKLLWENRNLGYPK